MIGSKILAYTIDPLDESSFIVFVRHPDGEETTEHLDDITACDEWGGGYILRFRTRDPVMVRKDGTVHMLVSEHA